MRDAERDKATLERFSWVKPIVADLRNYLGTDCIDAIRLFENGKQVYEWRKK